MTELTTPMAIHLAAGPRVTIVEGLTAIPVSVEELVAIEAQAIAPYLLERERLRDALEVISDGRHPDGHRGAVLVARAALEQS